MNPDPRPPSPSSRTVRAETEAVVTESKSPAPCPRCGWQYDAATLAAAARGEVQLDPLPTHACSPGRVQPPKLEKPAGDFKSGSGRVPSRSSTPTGSGQSLVADVDRQPDVRRIGSSLQRGPLGSGDADGEGLTRIVGAGPTGASLLGGGHAARISDTETLDNPGFPYHDNPMTQKGFSKLTATITNDPYYNPFTFGTQRRWRVDVSNGRKFYERTRRDAVAKCADLGLTVVKAFEETPDA